MISSLRRIYAHTTWRWGRALALLCVALHALASGSVFAETTAPASSGPEFRNEAISALPFDQLSEEAQAKIGAVVTRPTIYRRLPTETISCDGQMYLTLVRNPDIIVNIWQLMDVTDVTMDRSGPYSFTSDDKAGTLSQVEMLYGTANTHLYYATTHYEGPMFARPVNARVVLLLRSEYVRGADGVPGITSVMDAFIKIDHLTANIVARTMAPVVGKTADHNFVESFRFLARVSQTAEANGPGLQQLAMKLQRVNPAIRQQFADVAGAVAQRAVERAEAVTRSTTIIAAPRPSDAAATTPARPVSEPSPTLSDSQPDADDATSSTAPRTLRLRR
jgi:hypothetical protein